MNGINAKKRPAAEWMDAEAVYGVYGVIEWVALIRSGGATLRVHFEGGSMTGFGVVPATFSTRNRVISEIIMNSRPYREGKIHRIR